MPFLLIQIVLLFSLISFSAISADAKIMKNDIPLKSELIILYANKSPIVTNKEIAIKKIDNLLHAHYLVSESIEKERNPVFRAYFQTASQLFATGYVISAKSLMEGVSTIEGFKETRVGGTLKRMIDSASTDYSEEELSEEDDPSISQAFDIIHGYIQAYEQQIGVNNTKMDAIKMVVMGAAFGDLVAVDSGLALVTYQNDKKTVAKLRKQSKEINKKILALSGRIDTDD